jgi:hypothetical protein
MPETDEQTTTESLSDEERQQRLTHVSNKEMLDTIARANATRSKGSRASTAQQARA